MKAKAEKSKDELLRQLLKQPDSLTMSGVNCTVALSELSFQRLEMIKVLEISKENLPKLDH